MGKRRRRVRDEMSGTIMGLGKTAVLTGMSQQMAASAGGPVPSFSGFNVVYSTVPALVGAKTVLKKMKGFKKS